MNSRNDNENSGRDRAAIIGGVFALLAACVGGIFLVLNTMVDNGVIVFGMSNPSSPATATVTASVYQAPTSELPVIQPTQAVIIATASPFVVLQPTEQLPSPTITSRVIPQTASDAASLFGGPPASEWQTCPQETNCWLFKLPNNSFRVSVPEYCLNSNGSIDGWRYHGGYPEKPDAIEGTIRIWNSLEAAVIRCW